MQSSRSRINRSLACLDSRFGRHHDGRADGRQCGRRGHGGRRSGGRVGGRGSGRRYRVGRRRGGRGRRVGPRSVGCAVADAHVEQLVEDLVLLDHLLQLLIAQNLRQQEVTIS